MDIWLNCIIGNFDGNFKDREVPCERERQLRSLRNFRDPGSGEAPL